MELNNLIADIKKDGKLSNDELMIMLIESIENEEAPECTYKKLYSKCYGNHLTPSTCQHWVDSLQSGRKWTLEQTSDVGQRLRVDWTKITKHEFYACMNAFYPDFMKTAEEYQIQEDPEFFGGIVWDFFNDDDAHNKTPFTYYFTFVL